ncbi:hypothetical protein, partial [Klebsiella pneumoniae]|uniref:hypothetical protein n=1 Tax=Klebsiella pneumoniae TaxID=573 RepID=UPI0025A03088
PGSWGELRTEPGLPLRGVCRLGSAVAGQPIPVFWLSGHSSWMSQIPIREYNKSWCAFDGPTMCPAP